MSIKRYIAEKDTTITNAYKNDNLNRATYSNMGASDILEIFSIYGQVSDLSTEKSRILIQFPISQIISDRNNKLISPSGSSQFILKLTNSSHSDSSLENINFSVFPLSRSWTEGNGLDMEQYLDRGVANWISASNTEGWTIPGGDVIYSQEIQSFIESSTDNLEVDVTSIVEKWISGEIQNNGFLISLSSSLEEDEQSYYTKKFFARRSQFFFAKPIIEVRSNSSIKDKRNSFYASSSLADSEDNLNTLFLYNSVRGQLKNIPSIGTGSIFVSLYSGTVDSGPVGIKLSLNNSVQQVTGGFYSTGIYTASVSIDTKNQFLYDVWSDANGNQIHTGSVIQVKFLNLLDGDEIPEYILTMPTLKNSYKYNENVRFRIESKNKQWDSNVYHISAYEPDNTIIENLYYKIVRISDSYVAVDYGTGSYKHTLCSYDQSGNYFDFPMNILEPGFSYLLKYGFDFNGQFYELKQSFKFRVDK